MDVRINKLLKRKEQEEKLSTIKVRVWGWDYLVLPD